MRNRISIDELCEMQINAAGALPLDQIHLLIEEIDQEEKKIKAAKALIHDVLDNRFCAQAYDLRTKDGKEIGIANIKCGDYVVKADLKHKVTWDQELLAKIVVDLANMGEEPDEYVKTEYKVSETAYKNWPSSLSSMFDPARTVAHGGTSYKIEVAKPAKGRK